MQRKLGWITAGAAATALAIGVAPIEAASPPTPTPTPLAQTPSPASSETPRPSGGDADVDGLWATAPLMEKAAPTRVARTAIVSSPLALRRLPEDPTHAPITHSTTDFASWSVACESRGGDKACWAAASVVDLNGVKAKFKLGPAAPVVVAPEPEPAGKAGRIVVHMPPPPKPRYVMSVEAPADLDGALGLVVLGNTSSGVLDMSRGCDANACRVTVEVGPDLQPILGGAEGTAGVITVMGSMPSKAVQWKLRTDGLADAFRFARAETEVKEAPTPPPPVAGLRPATKPGQRDAVVAKGTGLRTLTTSALSLGHVEAEATPGKKPDDKGVPATQDAVVPAPPAQADVAAEKTAEAAAVKVAATEPVRARVTHRAVARVAPRHAPMAARVAHERHAVHGARVASRGGSRFVPQD